MNRPEGTPVAETGNDNIEIILLIINYILSILCYPFSFQTGNPRR
jgi:hypothetical protein